MTNDQLAAGQPVDGDDATVKEPFDPFAVRWDERANDEVPSDDEFCPLCEDGQDEQETETNPRLVSLHKHYADNSLHVEETRKCTQVSGLYDKTLRQHNTHHKPLVPKMVHQHYTQHAPTPAVLNAQEFHVFNTALSAIRSNMIFEIDRAGKVTVDPSNLRLYMQVKGERDKVAKALFNAKK
jgi:hypothetical protein